VLLLIVAGIFSLFVGNTISLQAKWMSAKSAKQFAQIVDYIREHFPEKLK
jgi:hypothetical protein